MLMDATFLSTLSTKNFFKSESIHNSMPCLIKFGVLVFFPPPKWRHAVSRDSSRIDIFCCHLRAFLFLLICNINILHLPLFITFFGKGNIKRTLFVLIVINTWWSTFFFSLFLIVKHLDIWKWSSKTRVNVKCIDTTLFYLLKAAICILWTSRLYVVSADAGIAMSPGSLFKFEASAQEKKSKPEARLRIDWQSLAPGPDFGLLWLVRRARLHRKLWREITLLYCQADQWVFVSIRHTFEYILNHILN